MDVPSYDRTFLHQEWSGSYQLHGGRRSLRSGCEIQNFLRALYFLVTSSTCPITLLQVVSRESPTTKPIFCHPNNLQVVCNKCFIGVASHQKYCHQLSLSIPKKKTKKQKKTLTCFLCCNLIFYHCRMWHGRLVRMKGEESRTYIYWHSTWQFVTNVVHCVDTVCVDIFPKHIRRVAWWRKILFWAPYTAHRNCEIQSSSSFKKGTVRW